MRILNIQRMSTEDGPGLRTTVFFKGCPLSCAWCHNPESISFEREVEWLAAGCIGCGSCIKACPNGALSFTEEGLRFDRLKCRRCFACEAACPTASIEIKGKDIDAETLFSEVIKDVAYFGKDGGVTLSGGEVTAQAAEAAKLLQKLKSAGIHTAVDTCGLCNATALDALLDYTDLFLYDIKIFDGESHKEFCGAPVQGILENFDYLVRRVGKEKLWVRTPIIPGATDSEENIAAIGAFINARAAKWELCAFNNLCKDKYSRLNRNWQFKDGALISARKMDRLAAVAAQSGTPAVWSGMTEREN